MYPCVPSEPTSPYSYTIEGLAPSHPSHPHDQTAYLHHQSYVHPSMEAIIPPKDEHLQFYPISSQSSYIHPTPEYQK